MCPGGGDQRTVLSGSIPKSCADVSHLLDCIRHPLVNAGRGLEHGGHQLLAHTLVSSRVGDLVEPRHELVALGGNELELILDAEAER
jgi:hypothetical protein